MGFIFLKINPKSHEVNKKAHLLQEDLFFEIKGPFICRKCLAYNRFSNSRKWLRGI